MGCEVLERTAVISGRVILQLTECSMNLLLAVSEPRVVILVDCNRLIGNIGVMNSSALCLVMALTPSYRRVQASNFGLTFSATNCGGRTDKLDFLRNLSFSA